MGVKKLINLAEPNQFETEKSSFRLLIMGFTKL